MSTILTIETILIEFAKTVKAMQFYPEGHPNLDASIEKTFNMLKESTSKKKNVKWTIERTGFLDGKLPVCRGYKPLEGLAKDMFFKKIHEIEFTRDITLEEWRNLLHILKMDSDSIKREGGVENLFVINNIHGIRLNEMKYDELRKRIIELEETRKKEELEKGLEHPTESETKEEVAQTPEDQLKADEEARETLENMLEKLAREKDTKAYQSLSLKIAEIAKPLSDGKNWDGLFPVLVIFAAHSNPENNRPPDQKVAATSALKGLLNPDITDYLTTILCNRNEKNRNELQQMLVLLGEAAMNHLLTILVDTENTYARRQIFNALALFGEMARIEAEKRIDDDRWYVVRQMVSLLGEIGNPQSIETIKIAYLHRDIRVKKEALKSLGKIPSQESRAFLLERLKEDDISLKLQAVICLGTLKDQIAIEPLGYLAQKRIFFDEDIEIRKEAARAIGMIGGERAVTILKNLLEKKAFFRKRQNDEVRSVAALSLGRIGGNEVLGILEQVSRTSKGIVQFACKKAMEGIR